MDIGAIVQHAADGTPADPSQPSHVGDRDIHPQPLLMEPLPV